MHINYPNWLEYCDLFDDYGPEELGLAWQAVHDHEVADMLFEQDSFLIAFLVDTELQDKLFLYFEDMQNYRPEYD